jgi:hypothetical protein
VKAKLILATLLVLLFNLPSSSQNTSVNADAVHKRHFVAVSLVRAINTGAIVYKSNHGGLYPSWATLVTSMEFHAARVLEQVAKYESQLANGQFSDSSEILPGWSLRMNVTADGQAYDLMLQDKSEPDCGFTLFTNETGLIWEATALGCENRGEGPKAGDQSSLNGNRWRLESVF